MFYKFDNYGWYDGKTELATVRSVDFPPPIELDYPREINKAWAILMPDMKSWRIVAYEAPTEEIKAKNVVSKAEFARLFGAVKFAEILQATQNNIEVKAGYEYAGLCDVIELNHPDTALYLGVLAKNGLLNPEQIQKISNNQPIW